MVHSIARSPSLQAYTFVKTDTRGRLYRKLKPRTAAEQTHAGHRPGYAAAPAHTSYASWKARASSHVFQSRPPLMPIRSPRSTKCPSSPSFSMSVHRLHSYLLNNMKSIISIGNRTLPNTVIGLRISFACGWSDWNETLDGKRNTSTVTGERSHINRDETWRRKTGEYVGFSLCRGS